MRLDLDVKFVPFAFIIWFTCICCFYIELKYIIFSIFFLIFFFKIINIEVRLIFIYSLCAFITVLLCWARIIVNNEITSLNLKVGQVIIVTGQVVSDGILKQNINFGTIKNNSKFEYELKLKTLKIINSRSNYDIHNTIKILVDQNEEKLNFGEQIKAKGKLEKNVFGQVQYILRVQNFEIISDANFVNKYFNNLRNRFTDSTKFMNKESAGLLPGLILGDTRNQSKKLKSDMQISGLTHLTAVSGGNIAILLLAILWVSKKMHLKLRTLFIINLIFLIQFIFLVRAEPSVIRAGLMGLVTLLAVLRGTRRHGINALSIAICISLLLDPFLSNSWGFCLSVFATGGLLILTNPIINFAFSKFPYLNEKFIAAIAVALSAQISTLGLVVGFTGQISIWSVIANLLVAPVIPFITVLGYLALVIVNLNLEISSIINFISGFFTNWIIIIAHFFASQNLNQIQIQKGFISFLSVNLIMIIIYFYLIKSKTYFFLKICGSITLVSFMSLFIIGKFFKVSDWPISNAQFVMCDVGQGDGLVVKDSKNNVIVVDVGPDGNLMTNCLKKLKVSKIDVLILTHFHIDHVNGLEEIYSNFPINHVYTTWVNEPEEESLQVQNILGKNRIKFLISGGSFKIGDISIKCLWPMRKKMLIESIANNSSVVVIASIGNASALLTGDVEPPAQKEIRTKWINPNVDLIKIPHHGSKFQDQLFPKWSGARLALISVGDKNTYGHPSKETIKLYENSGIKVIDSATSGSVSIFIDKDDSIKYSMTN